MYIIIAGAGKVGWNLARELIGEGHEVTLIESDRNRFLMVEEELEHSVQHGDASELWVLERGGIVRADMVVAVTGDDEDNMLISQVAKEKYLVEHTIARVNNPRNLEHFELLGIRPVVSATDLILRLIEHEVPHHGLVHLLDLRQEQLEIIELEVAEGAPAAGGDDRRAGAAGGLPGRVGAAQRHRLRAQGRHRDRGRRRGARGAEPRRRARGVPAVRRVPRQRRRRAAVRRRPAQTSRSFLKRPRVACRCHPGTMRGVRNITCLLVPPAWCWRCGLRQRGPGRGPRQQRRQGAHGGDARALQTGLVTRSLVQADIRRSRGQPGGGAAGQGPHQPLHDRDPHGAGIVQVRGRRRRTGDAGRDQLAPASGREPYYVAAWQGAGTHDVLRRAPPPAYTASCPGRPRAGAHAPAIVRSVVRSHVARACGRDIVHT